MNGRNTDFWAWIAAMLFVSVAVHVFVFMAIGWVPVPKFTEARLEEVDFEFVEVPEPEEPEEEVPEEPEPEPEEEEPEPVAPEPPEPPPEPVRPPPAPENEPPPPPDEPPPPAEETPVAFDNVVLTNEGGDSSWSTEQASGVERSGPIGRPGAAVTGRSREGTRGGTPGGTGRPSGPPGPPVVAMGDLSQRPVPPSDLDGLLRRYYPDELKRQGVEGEAVVRIRINPDGRIAVLGVRSASNPEFGSACARMLQRSGRWGEPKGPRGDPAATVSVFTCNFTVDY